MLAKHVRRIDGSRHVHKVKDFGGNLAKHNRVCLSIMDLPSVPESPPVQTDNENHWGN
jgi:hypothetical protein